MGKQCAMDNPKPYRAATGSDGMPLIPSSHQNVIGLIKQDAFMISNFLQSDDDLSKSADDNRQIDHGNDFQIDQNEEKEVKSDHDGEVENDSNIEFEIDCVCGSKLIKMDCSDLCVQSKFHLVCNDCKQQVATNTVVYHCKKRNKKEHENLNSLYSGYDICSGCALKRHEAQKKMIYKCKFCNFKAERRHELNTHSRIHAAEKALVCVTCGKRTKSKSGLKNRMRIHNKH